jgi:hypothetical protein
MKLLQRGGAAALMLSAFSSLALAQDDSGREPWFEDPPPPLPQNRRGDVRPRQWGERPAQVDKLSQVLPYIATCWVTPAGSGYSGQEVTVNVSFRRDGSVIGKPRITYYREGTQKDRREDFVRSVLKAFEDCTPVPFTSGLGAANAGRIFSFRFIDSQPL